MLCLVFFDLGVRNNLFAKARNSSSGGSGISLWTICCSGRKLSYPADPIVRAYGAYSAAQSAVVCAARFVPFAIEKKILEKNIPVDKVPAFQCELCEMHLRFSDKM